MTVCSLCLQTITGHKQGIGPDNFYLCLHCYNRYNDDYPQAGILSNYNIKTGKTGLYIEITYEKFGKNKFNCVDCGKTPPVYGRIYITLKNGETTFRCKNCLQKQKTITAL